MEPSAKPGKTLYVESLSPSDNNIADRKLEFSLRSIISLPGGVIGNTREFGSRFSGSSPDWAV
jgi:hypothetical protein